MKYKIQANASGTRSIEIDDVHMQTIEKYGLLQNLAGSTGIIDEDVLEKLRLHCRSILETQSEVDRELMNLCLDVVYHPNMKAIGLQNLQKAFGEWKQSLKEEEPKEEEPKEEQ
ncbi:MAG: hypothetical protein K5893_05185 [Prevotella sp.]|nr:hypothetical protein [Prevotella sp.]